MIDHTTGDDSQIPAEKLQAIWESTGPVELDDFLADWPDLDTRMLAEVVTVDQRERWRTSAKVIAESYFERFPRLKDDPESALWVVYGEILAVIERGESPDLPGYQSRFPFLAEMLALQWEVHEAFQIEDTITRIRQIATDDPSPKLEPEGYEVYEEIGRGALGVVHRALHRRLDHFVALKMLRDAPLQESDAAGRFLKEARLMAKLEHPRIVRVFDCGRHEGRPFIAMELIKGETLDAKLNGQVLPPKDAASMLLAVAEGVAFAHRHQIIHRDLKPANILIDENGEPKISDFGLARQENGGLAVTRTGEFAGTPAYMSPEQALNRGSIGPRSDIYSLGAILYEMLTGRPPHLAPSFAETLLLVIRQPPISPRKLNILVPASLAAICMKCLEKDPARRYASADDLHDDLQRFLNDERPLAKGLANAIPWSRASLTIPLVGAFLGAILIGLVTSSYLAGWVPIRRSEPKITDPKTKITVETNKAETTPEASSPVLNSPNFESGILRVPTTAEDQLQLVFHPDGRSIASPNPHGGFDLWNVDDGSLKRSFRMEERGRAVCFTPDGTQIVTGGNSESIRVWNIVDGTLIKSIRNSGGWTFCLSHHPTLPEIAVGCGGGAILTFDTASGAQKTSFKGSTESAVAIAYTPDGSRFVTASFDSGVRVWDRATGQHVLNIATSKPAIRLSVSPDGESVLTSTWGKSFDLWNLRDGKNLARFVGHGKTVTGVAFSGHGERIYSCSLDGTLRVWHPGTHNELLKVQVGPELTQLAVSRDGGSLAASAKDGLLRIWNTQFEDTDHARTIESSSSDR